ncbi:MAG: Mth938-like domain-containing protein [Pseudomonadota bacterium]|nr:Mth938-like domain-containing protein [Pseudomonadota bacterium]
MVDIKTFGEGSDLQLIHGYGDGGFRVSGTRHVGGLFLLPRLSTAWTPPLDIDGLTADDLLPLLGDPAPPLLVFGAGEAPQHSFTDLGTALRIHGIAFELLSTPAACRTWNVLMSEGRSAAAALVAI